MPHEIVTEQVTIGTDGFDTYLARPAGTDRFPAVVVGFEISASPATCAG